MAAPEVKINFTGSNTLSATLAQVRGGLAQLPGPLGGVADGLLGMNAASLTLAAGIGVAVGAGVALAQELVRITQETIAYETAITDLADRTQTSTEWISKFAEAADDASIATRGHGVELNQVAAGLSRFEMMLGRGEIALAGMGQSGASAFQRMGIALEDADGNARGTQAVLLDVADAMQGMASQAEKVALAKRLGLYEMLPLLQQGREGMQQMMDSINDARVVTDQDARAVKELAAAQDNLNDSTKALSLTIGKQLVPALALAATNFNTDLIKGGEAMRALGDETRPLNERLNKFLTLVTMSRESYNNMALATRNAGSAFHEFGEWGQQVPPVLKQIEGGINTIAGLQYDLATSTDSERFAAQWKVVADASERENERARKAVEAHRLEIEALKRGISTPLPTRPPSETEKLKLAVDLQMGGKDAMRAFEADTVLQMGARMTELKVPFDKVLPVVMAAKGGLIDLAGAMRMFNQISPSAANALAPFLAAAKEVENKAGVPGSATLLGFKQVSGRVEATEEDKKRLIIAQDDLNKEMAAREKATDDAQRARHDLRIIELKRQVTEKEQAVKGYWTSTTIFDPNAPANVGGAVDAQRWQAMGQAMGVGAPLVKGLAQSVTAEQATLNTAVKDLIVTTQTQLNSNEATAVWTQAGSNYMAYLADGIRSNAEKVKIALQDVSKTQSRFLVDYIYEQVWRMLHT